MDPFRFDLLTRVLSVTPSRRAIDRSLAGLTLGWTLSPLLGPVDAVAKKHKRKARCGPCQIKKKGKCKGKKSDFIVCAVSRECRGGACECNRGTTEIAGRCTAPCGPACTEPCGHCIETFDTDIEVCGRYNPGDCSGLLPCVDHGDCAQDELCTATGCEPIGGVTNRCQRLCDTESG